MTPRRGLCANQQPVDPSVRLFRLIYLLLGIGLLAAVITASDLAAVNDWLFQLGLIGVVAVFVIYCCAFLCDSGSWWLMLSGDKLEAVWLYRLWRVRMVGEAFNAIIPAASLGGEPIKVLLLKRLHGTDYRAAAASLVMAKTIILFALIGFSAIGLTVMMQSDTLAEVYGALAGAGLAALACGGLGFFAIQRWSMASRLAGWLARHRMGRRLERALIHLRTIDDSFKAFYHQRPGRFAIALGLALVSWLLGAVELYLVLGFFGHGISVAEALIIDSVLQLIRAGTFFIPASLGVSEMGFVVLVGALTGQPPLGLAAAIVRRSREVLWIAWGLLLGWRLSFTPSMSP